MADRLTTVELEALLEEPPVERATILPLDYTDLRSEHSIMYFSSRWESLVGLLEDPYATMRRIQEQFRQEGERHFCWRLSAPVTVIVQPGEPIEDSKAPEPKAMLGSMNVRAAIQLENILSEHLSKTKGVEWESIQEDSHDDLADLIAKAQAKGCFLAEFAVDTAIMLVWYWPPREPSSERRLTKKFTRGVIGMMPGRRRVGTLHIDVGTDDEDPPTALDRAHLIVDLLESRDWFIDEMKSRTDFQMGKVPMARKGDVIAIPDKPMVGTFRDLVDNDLGQDPQVRPTIIVERLSPMHDPMRLELKKLKEQMGEAGSSEMDMPDPNGSCNALCCNFYLNDPNDHGKPVVVNSVLMKCYDRTDQTDRVECPPLAEVEARASAAQRADRQRRRVRPQPDPEPGVDGTE